MAGRKFTVKSGAVTLLASTTRTILAVTAPSTHGLILTSMEVSFEVAAATDRGYTVEYVTWTTDGTGTAVTAIDNADRQDDGSPTFTAKKNYTVEPTIGEIVIRSGYVGGDKGNDSFPGGLRLKASETFGVRIIAPATPASNNVRVTFGGDE